MKALVYLGPERLELLERDVPRPREGEALVRVRYSGICGTDLSILAGKHPRAKPPLVMGHELAGEIAEIGGERTGRRNLEPDMPEGDMPASDKPDGAPRDAFRPGDRVTVEPLISCGTCFTCRSGFSYVCQNLKLYGIDADGAFAEYVRLPLASLYHVPDGLDLRLAVLIEPAAVAVHAVRLSTLKVTDSVCVIGAGPIGLLTGLVARIAGAAQVVLCERDRSRIALAAQHGFPVIDTERADPVAETMALTAGRGMDVVFEAAGGPTTHLLALKICRVRGEVIQVAIPKDQVATEMVPLTFKELVIRGVRVYAPFDFERAIHLLASARLDLSRWITVPFRLDQGIEAFRQAKAGAGVLRVLFEN